MLDLGTFTTEEWVHPKREGGYDMCCDTTVWSAQNEISRLRFRAFVAAPHCVSVTAQLGESGRFGVMRRCR